MTDASGTDGESGSRLVRCCCSCSRAIYNLTALGNFDMIADIEELP